MVFKWPDFDVLHNRVSRDPVLNSVSTIGSDSRVDFRVDHFFNEESSVITTNLSQVTSDNQFRT